MIIRLNKITSFIALLSLVGLLSSPLSRAGESAQERVVVTSEGDNLDAAMIQALNDAAEQFERAHVVLADYSNNLSENQYDRWLEAANTWLDRHNIKLFRDNKYQAGTPKGLALVAKNGEITQHIVDRECTEGRCTVIVEFVVDITNLVHNSLLEEEQKSIGVGEFSGYQSDQFKLGLSAALEATRLTDETVEAEQEYLVIGRVKNAVSIKHVADNSHYIQRTGEYVEDKQTNYRTSAEVEFQLIHRASNKSLFEGEVGYSSVENNLPQLLERAQAQIASMAWDQLDPLQVLVASNGEFIVEVGSRRLNKKDRYAIHEKGDGASDGDVQRAATPVAVVEVAQSFSDYVILEVVTGDPEAIKNLAVLKRIKWS